MIMGLNYCSDDYLTKLRRKILDEAIKFCQTQQSKKHSRQSWPLTNDPPSNEPPPSPI